MFGNADPMSKVIALKADFAEGHFKKPPSKSHLILKWWLQRAHCNWKTRNRNGIHRGWTNYYTGYIYVKLKPAPIFMKSMLRWQR
jgi:hypothetical protein